jgi:hypothetical protein
MCGGDVSFSRNSRFLRRDLNPGRTEYQAQILTTIRASYYVPEVINNDINTNSEVRLGNAISY